MHEGAMTEDLLKHALIHAKEANASRIVRVKVTIGVLSDATPESIEMYFSMFAPGTIAEGAALEFATAPGHAHCNTCGKDVTIEMLYSPCPECGAFDLTITGGNGVYLESLEIEKEGMESVQIHE